MQLTCAHCGYIAKSVLLDQKQALGETLQNFVKHIIEAHKDKQQAIMQDTMKVSAIAASAITLAKHSTLLDQELDTTDLLQQEFSKMVDELEECLGIEMFDNRPGDSVPVNPLDPKPPQNRKGDIFIGQ